MIFHIVLFRPRPDLPPASRQRFVEALRAAHEAVPSIRRFHVGRRVTHGRSYESAMTEDFPYAAVIEFDDAAGLREYLEHSAHEELGLLFGEAMEAGLIYDYVMTAPSDSGQWAVGGSRQ
jgi:hypothetical protein